MIFFRYTTKEMLYLAAQYATSREATRPLPILGGMETTPSSSKAMPSSIVVQGTTKDAKGGKKRWKRCPQWAATRAGCDNNDDGKQADNSDMEHIMTAGHSIKHHTRSLTDHFKRLLEESYPNHMYPIKHKLRDCGLMKSFMISGSLT
jgi:hypothetical protein